MTQNKMKILQLLCVPLYGTGSGTYVRKLSEALVEKGHEVAIAAPDKRQTDYAKVFEIKLPFMATFTGQPEHPEALLYSQMNGSKLNDIQSAFQNGIVQVVEEYKPDVIHVHHAANLSWIANYIKAVYQIHYVITSHNTDVMNAILDKRYIPLTQDAMNRADFITAVAKNTRERLLKILGKGFTSFTRKTKVVPCGVSVKEYSTKGSTFKIERQYGLTNKKIALYSGKVTMIKGVDLFVKAAKSFPEMTFVVMGDGNARKDIEEIVVKQKIKNVIFTGYLGAGDKKTIADFYRLADVVVVPSTVSEGIPLSALEAMASGTPVIGSDLGGIPTAVRHMKNGILIKPKSVSAIVEAIKTVLSNKKLYEKMSQRARQDAVAKFDWEIIARKMEKYYKITYDRSCKNRASKKPSYVSEEEYLEDKEAVLQIKEERERK